MSVNERQQFTGGMSGVGSQNPNSVTSDLSAYNQQNKSSGLSGIALSDNKQYDNSQNVGGMSGIAQNRGQQLETNKTGGFSGQGETINESMMQQNNSVSGLSGIDHKRNVEEKIEQQQYTGGMSGVARQKSTA